LPKDSSAFAAQPLRWDFILKGGFAPSAAKAARRLEARSLRQ